MELAPVYIFDVGFIFFAGWGAMLAAFGIIAFGRDLLPSAPRNTKDTKSHEGF
jgi:hypothetical protein